MEPTPFSILQWNIRGYHSQRPYIQHLIDKIKPQIMCFQETHLKPSNSSHIPQYQYPPLRKDRSNRRGGGVSIFFRRDLPFVQLNITSDLEIICSTVFSGGLKLSICNIYLGPDEQNNQLKSKLESVIGQLQPPYLILMDANAHHSGWGSPSNSILV